ncbi:MAG: hypothetical protein ACRC8K_17770, partial [Waterburya sp.]
MNFDFDFLSKIVLGTILGSCLTAWFNREKNKRDLCIQVYEKWISNPLYQDRKEVLRQLKTFFDQPLPPGYHWSHEYEKIKLFELKYLSTPSHNYQPQNFSEDFIDKFIYVMIF